MLYSIQNSNNFIRFTLRRKYFNDKGMNAFKIRQFVDLLVSSGIATNVEGCIQEDTRFVTIDIYLYSMKDKDIVIDFVMAVLDHIYMLLCRPQWPKYSKLVKYVEEQLEICKTEYYTRLTSMYEPSQSMWDHSQYFR